MTLDLLIRNARVLTVDPRRPSASTLGIWNGSIVGLDEEVAGASARCEVDLDGAVLAPGFHDAHCHTTSFGLGLVSLDLAGCVGVEATLAAVASYAEGLGPDEWVIGFGYGGGIGASEDPRHQQLDRAGGGRPVWLTHRTGHSCVVSTRVLEAVGITGSLAPGGRGAVEVDEEGQPTGLIEETAMDLVKEYVGPSSIERMAEAIDRATAHYLTEGITGFTDAGIGSPGIDHTPVELAAYQLAHRTGRLHTRAQVMAFNELFHAVRAHPDDGISTGLDLGIHTGFGDDWLSLGAMKVWVDGSGLGHSAATTDGEGGIRGSFDNDPDLLTRSIVEAHRAGWQVAAHAIGDAAVDLVLDALDEAASGGPFAARAGGTPRHRLEHGVMFRSDQVERLARMGMTVVTQPQFIDDFGGALLELFEGSDGARDYFRVRTLLDAGVPVVGSSDRPVTAGSPLQGIQAMIERTTADGKVFGAHESVTAVEALAAYTAAGARAAHCEDRWGMLASRRLADLVVLGDDPTTVAVERIGAIDVVATLVGGEVAHDPSSLFDEVAHE